MNHIQKLLPIALLLAGCASYPENAERGPSGTIAYYVQIESEHPGRKIEVNGEYVGQTPCTIKVWGDRDGTFHRFNSDYFDIVAHAPPDFHEVSAKKRFNTGGDPYSGEDRVPSKIYFPTTGVAVGSRMGGDSANVNVWIR